MLAKPDSDSDFLATWIAQIPQRQSAVAWASAISFIYSLYEVIRTCAQGYMYYTIDRAITLAAAEVTLSSLTLASRTATTLSVTWSAGYPKCYSFTVSHSTQDGSITVIQPADNDTSHTLISLQPGTTYRIEVEAVRKRAKVMQDFTTVDVGREDMTLFYKLLRSTTAMSSILYCSSTRPIINNIYSLHITIP